MTKTETIVEVLIKPVINELGYELYDVEFVKESSEYFLRIYIEKENHTIDLDDCETVSEAVGEVLDEADPISQAYNLEISSCGLERHLREDKHFMWALGKKILVKLYKALDGQKEYEGVLQIYFDGALALKLESDELITIPREDVASAKILYNWEELKNE